MAFATWLSRLKIGGNASGAAQRSRRIPALIYWSPLALAFGNYFYTVKLISGRSMQPTLNPDSSLWRDFGLFDKFSIRSRHGYQRGDIVAIVSPENPRRMIVKRILAVEGDTVRTLPPHPDPEVRVPVGHVWVEGDDSFHTDDSNRLGPIPAALIDSKLMCILWPFNRIGRVTVPTTEILNSVHDWTRRSVQDAIERDKWRKSRVTKSSHSVPRGPHVY
ncbi:hypothetical protein EYR40_005407 [Pleurotus pulmonarius]|nr:hypothetical protein EYR40_005407 [Pleurotus pulmonarius]